MIASGTGLLTIAVTLVVSNITLMPAQPMQDPAHVLYSLGFENDAPLDPITKLLIL